MGDSQVIVPFALASGARLEVAVEPEHLVQAAGPFEPPAVPPGAIDTAAVTAEPA